MAARAEATVADRQAVRDMGTACRQPSGEERSPDFLECFLTSRFVIATLLFCMVCGLLATFHLGQMPVSQFPERTWASWAIEDFQKLPRPQVVFLGSSLVLVPLAGVDANFLNQKLDGSQHHRSVYFEQNFSKALGHDVHSFNFALPGEMPSDAYLITDFLLEGGKKPDLLVYGLGPRDFMDNVLPSPAATDPFRSLSRLGDISSMLERMMPDWIDRLNYQMARIFYLYGKREDLSQEFATFAQKKLNRVLPVPPGSSPYTVAMRRQLLPFYRPSELNASEAFFRPSAGEKFADNLAEYRKRYATVKWDTFTTQMRFFAELLDVAKEREIKVVIVSMPITDLNRSLIKDYAWDAYRHSVHVLATLKGATFVDLQGSGKFRTADFMDTVHLHAGGGQKMLDELIASLSNNPSVRAAVLDSPMAKKGEAPVSEASVNAVEKQAL
jgi:hypothetical protein